MPQPKRYKDHAERQRAYRERKANGIIATLYAPPQPQPQPQVSNSPAMKLTATAPAPAVATSLVVIPPDRVTAKGQVFMTATTIDQNAIEAALAAAEQRKRDAQQAERDRIAREAAPAAALAEAEREISRIRHLQWQAAFLPTQQAAKDAVTAVQQATNDLLAKIASGDVKAARALREAYTAKVQAAKYTYSEAKAALTRMPGIGQTASVYPERDSVVGPYLSAIGTVPDLGQALVLWVAGAGPDGPERQYRRGLAYAFCGQFCDPAYDAMLDKYQRRVY